MVANVASSTARDHGTEFLRLRFDACTVASGLLLFNSEPVTGMVAMFAADDPSLDPLQAALLEYRDGLLVGAYSETLIDLDLSYCWDGDALDAIEGHDHELGAGTVRGSSVFSNGQFIYSVCGNTALALSSDPNDNPRSIGWHQDGSLRVLTDLLTVEAHNTHAQVGWGWHNNGRLDWSILRFYPPYLYTALVTSFVAFDDSGGLRSLRIDQGFEFAFASEVASLSRYWTLSSAAALAELPVGAELHIGDLHPRFESEIIEALASRLHDVRQLTLAGSAISLQTAERLTQLPQLDTLDIRGSLFGTGLEHRFGPLLDLATAHKQRRPESRAKLGGSKLVDERQLADVLEHPGTHAYVYDVNFTELVAIKGHRLAEHQIELALESQSVRHVHQTSSSRHELSALDELKRARPDIDVQANGRALRHVPRSPLPASGHRPRAADPVRDWRERHYEIVRQFQRKSIGQEATQMMWRHYEELAPLDRPLINQELARQACEPLNPSDRFVALGIIARYEIVDVLPALMQLKIELASSEDPPDRFDLKRVTKIVGDLSNADPTR